MITIIAAVAQNRALGKDNDLIWHIPNDLKRFKLLTSGHVILMGRKTFESLGRPLPNRTNVVISKNNDFKAEGCIIFSDIDKALNHFKKSNEKIYIIGGAQIYKACMDIADELEITEVHEVYDADVYFPEIDLAIWKEIRRENHQKEENKPAYSFVTYQK